jgi:hypothetical protein
MTTTSGTTNGRHLNGMNHKKKSPERRTSLGLPVSFFFSFLFLFLLLTIIFSYYWLITTQPPLARKHEVGVVL